MKDQEITRYGVVVPVPVDPAGIAGPTPGQARGGKWRRTAPNRFVPADTDSDALEQRIVEAYVGGPAGSAVTGWAALAWLGARWFSGFGPDGKTCLPVPVALGDRRSARGRPGSVYSEDWLFADDVVRVDGLPITVPARAVTYEVRRARTLLRAVRAIDMACADDLVSIEELCDYAARLAGRQGVEILRRALGFANENVWSPQEDTLRLPWQQRVRHPLLCNPPIFDLGGSHLLTPDVFDPFAGVAGEYDGEVHGQTGRRRTDLNRASLYRDLDIEVVTMMSSAYDDVTSFERRLQAAYDRSARRAASTRRWTLDQPEWWIDTSTVAARRQLTPEQQGIWLRRNR